MVVEKFKKRKPSFGFLTPDLENVPPFLGDGDLGHPWRHKRKKR
ncbi:hypothetical protein ERO13_D05G291850v2 [Gossypium hirsutum]|nr:hypothetical protein ERO13_D05G291850v2 [Gossypium hirsutum]